MKLRSFTYQLLSYLLIQLKSNDREITQKKQRPDPNPNDIKTTVFCRNEKVQIVERLLRTTMLSK